MKKTIEKTEQVSTLAERIKALRLSKKLSQADFAFKLGLANDSGAAILESGACAPTAKVLVEMAEVYKVDIHELLTGKPNPAIENEVESLRRLKHEYRELLNKINQAVEALSIVDGKISVRIRSLDSVLEKADVAAEKIGKEHGNGEKKAG